LNSFIGTWELHASWNLNCYRNLPQLLHAYHQRTCLTRLARCRFLHGRPVWTYADLLHQLSEEPVQYLTRWLRILHLLENGFPWLDPPVVFARPNFVKTLLFLPGHIDHSGDLWLLLPPLTTSYCRLVCLFDEHKANYAALCNLEEQLTNPHGQKSLDKPHGGTHKQATYGAAAGRAVPAIMDGGKSSGARGGRQKGRSARSQTDWARATSPPVVPSPPSVRPSWCWAFSLLLWWKYETVTMREMRGVLGQPYPSRTYLVRFGSIPLVRPHWLCLATEIPSLWSWVQRSEFNTPTPRSDECAAPIAIGWVGSMMNMRCAKRERGLFQATTL
jgi:hypothetical protein